MQSIARNGLFILILFIGLGLFGGVGTPSTHAAPPTPTTRTMPRIVTRATQQVSSLRILTPPNRLVSAPTATITVNYLAGGTQDIFGDACQTVPAQAKTAINYAASIWASQIPSAVPIKIRVCWAGLGAAILGYSNSISFHRDFAGGVAGYWYYSALANATAQTDLNDSDGIDWDGDALDSDAEIEIALSTAISWYSGTDGAVPAGQYDLVTIVLHEIGHGLGIMGWVDYTAGQGSWGLDSGSAGIYDRFIENGAGQKILNTSLFPNPSAALGAQLTSNNLYFNGANARAANGGNRPKLYAPSTWQPGSSYAHLDEIYNGTANALMTYSFGYQEVVHSPGPIALGIIKDLGWTQPVECYPLTTNVTPSSAGTVSASPAPNCGTKYTAGTVVTLTATPNVGYALTSWSGNASGSANSTPITMNGDKSVTANFGPTCYSLETNAAPDSGGRVNISPAPNCGSDKYLPLTNVTLTATPYSGYSFYVWSGITNRSAPTASVTMNGNKDVVAIFNSASTKFFFVPMIRR